MNNENYQRLKFYTITATIINIILFFLFLGVARADNYSVNEVVNAIYKAESGAKTNFPYGIKSIDTKGNVAYAKRICRQSVVNNYKRWLKANKPKCFIEFMRDRFCPLSDSKLNANWVKNVKYWLVKNRG